MPSATRATSVPSGETNLACRAGAAIGFLDPSSATSSKICPSGPNEEISIALPSGSHRTRKLGFSTPLRSVRRFEPSASITTSDDGSLLLGQLSLALQGCEKKAIFVPSGDHD